MEYGTAIENFFNLECSLILMFLVLTILAVPQIAIFASYNAQENFSNVGVLDRFSFAGLG